MPDVESNVCYGCEEEKCNDTKSKVCLEHHDIDPTTYHDRDFAILIQGNVGLENLVDVLATMRDIVDVWNKSGIIKDPRIALGRSAARGEMIRWIHL